MQQFKDRVEIGHFVCWYSYLANIQLHVFDSKATEIIELLCTLYVKEFLSY